MNPLLREVQEQKRKKHPSIADIHESFNQEELSQLHDMGREALDLAYVRELKRRQLNKYSQLKQKENQTGLFKNDHSVVKKILGYSLLERKNGIDDIREVKNLRDYHRERKEAVESALSHMKKLKRFNKKGAPSLNNLILSFVQVVEEAEWLSAQEKPHLVNVVISDVAVRYHDIRRALTTLGLNLERYKLLLGAIFQELLNSISRILDKLRKKKDKMTKATAFSDADNAFRLRSYFRSELLKNINTETVLNNIGVWKNDKLADFASNAAFHLDLKALKANLAKIKLPDSFNKGNNLFDEWTRAKAQPIDDGLMSSRAEEGHMDTLDDLRYIMEYDYNDAPAILPIPDSDMGQMKHSNHKLLDAVTRYLKPSDERKLYLLNDADYLEMVNREKEADIDEPMPKKNILAQKLDTLPHTNFNQVHVAGTEDVQPYASHFTHKIIGRPLEEYALNAQNLRMTVINLEDMHRWDANIAKKKEFDEVFEDIMPGVIRKDLNIEEDVRIDLPIPIAPADINTWPTERKSTLRKSRLGSGKSRPQTPMEVAAAKLEALPPPKTQDRYNLLSPSKNSDAASKPTSAMTDSPGPAVPATPAVSLAPVRPPTPPLIPSNAIFPADREALKQQYERIQAIMGVHETKAEKIEEEVQEEEQVDPRTGKKKKGKKAPLKVKPAVVDTTLDIEEYVKYLKTVPNDFILDSIDASRRYAATEAARALEDSAKKEKERHVLEEAVRGELHPQINEAPVPVEEPMHAPIPDAQPPPEQQFMLLPTDGENGADLEPSVSTDSIVDRQRAAQVKEESEGEPEGVGALNDISSLAPKLLSMQDRLEAIWNQAQMSTEERLDMAIKYSASDFLDKMERAIILWEKSLVLIRERENIMMQLATLERELLDPDRYMTEQAALLEDEKRRSVLLSPLKRNESKLSKLLMKLRLNFGDVVKIDGVDYAAKMKHDYSTLMYAINREYKQKIRDNPLPPIRDSSHARSHSADSPRRNVFRMRFKKQ